MRLRQLVYQLRTEGAGPGREAAAVGVGVFIGCLPIFGFHLLLCVAVSTLFRLNRLKTYLAANISNPLVAPWLLFAEVQAGAWLRRGSFHELSLETIRATGVRTFGADLLVGSVAIGAVLAALAAWGTLVLVGRHPGDRFADLVRRASDRYAAASITAWEFARGKLRHDPIYRALVEGGLLQSGGTLVDVGCGQGLTLALLAEARKDGSGPVFDRLVGIELRPRVAAMAAAALGGEAVITEADARATGIEPADAILFLDVLHMMPRDDQEALLTAAREALRTGGDEQSGVMVIREADADAGWRFRMVAFGNRLKALAFGHWGQRFYFRSVADWISCLSQLGLRAEAREMGQGTPFANVVFVVRSAAAATTSSRRTDTSTAGVT
jgi:uncharacterized protein (DUF2062 family)